LRPAGGPGIRDDRGFETGSDVPVYYDSLVSKLVVWGGDRAHAIARLRRALDEYEITGIETTIPFFQWLLDQAFFAAGDFDTTTVDRLLSDKGVRPWGRKRADLVDMAAIAAAVHVLRRSGRFAGENDRPHSAATPDRGSRWKRIGRLEALRDDLRGGRAHRPRRMAGG
jgi:acetyl/propionyl-CoA carboxylase alpha subunit